MPKKNPQAKSEPSAELTATDEVKGPPDADAANAIDKLSVTVGHEISERLRSLAYSHRLSESSIVEVALTMFFARGDDALLGLILRELGATLRRR
jgi:hypothetical protein